MLTFLGTTDYKVTTYAFGSQRHTTRYCAAALARFLRPERTLVVVTQKAREMHFEALADELATVTQPEEVPIPDGREEAELWQIFDALTEHVPQGGQLVADITNGFRSLPFLSFLAVAYLRAAKEVDVQGVYYGAYEARNEQDESPVFDLTPFVTLLDWTIATDRFIRFGDARDLAERLRAGMPAGELIRDDPAMRQLSKSLKWAADAMQNTSLALRLNRPFESMEQAHRLVRTLQEQHTHIESHMRPFALLTERVVQAYQSLALEMPRKRESRLDNLRIQGEMVRWYMDKEQVVQAVTLAREWLISLLLCRLTDRALDDLGVRRQIEDAISNAAERCRLEAERRSPLMTPFTDDIAALPQCAQLVEVWTRLSTLRNDLAHAGMRPDAADVRSILKRADEVCAQLDQLAAQLVPEAASRSGTMQSQDITEREMILLNFGHPLTPEQRGQIEQLAGQPIDRLIEVPTHFDQAQPFAEQVRALVDSLGLTSEEWQHAAIFVNPPTLSTIAMTLLAELHGRMGYFPPVVRMRPVEDVLPPRFEAAEIINLQHVRTSARERR
ncbi:MAG: TIGR02221 family CRISPR-associated protein [Ardenticatenia bacterium]|nr:MAG: TIGR02221 family CRISPR-associated protein [Ardenticatenia bacterium]